MTVRTLADLRRRFRRAKSYDGQDVRDLLASAWLPWHPATAGALDDLFVEDNEADWTVVTASGTATWRYNNDRKPPSVSCVFEDQSVGDWSVYLKALPGITTGDYIQTRTHIVKPSDTVYGHAMLVFADGVTTGSNIAAFGIEIDLNEAYKIVSVEGTLTNATTFEINASSPIGEVVGGAPLHWRLEYDAANTFAVFWSPDGHTFTPFNPASFTYTMTPTHGGLMVGSYGAGNENVVTFDYFHTNV